MGSGAYLNPCCFGVHPINGAVAVAFVSILGAVGVLAFSFFTYFSWITYVYVAGCVIAFFNNLLLIYGVSSRKPFLLVPWLVMTNVFVILCFVVLIINFVAIFEFDDRFVVKYVVPYIVAYGLLTVVETYFWFVVFAARKALLRGEPSLIAPNV